jgi:hypothetical protein
MRTPVLISTILLLLVATIVFKVAGRKVSDREEIRQSPIEVEFDAGIGFSDQSSYFCLPIDRFGLPLDEHFQVKQVSCECVEADWVQVEKSEQVFIGALMIDFIPDSAAYSASRTNVVDELAVLIQLKADSGLELDVIVRFVRTNAPHTNEPSIYQQSNSK